MKKPGQSKRILIVEDEIDILETLEDMLLMEGFEILKAHNGEEGFFMAIREIPDLILSDVMMPLMNGYELLEAVRSFPKTEFIPFIMLTAKSAGDSIREGMQRGADDYITKPFDRTDLIQSIKYRLRHHEDLMDAVVRGEQKRLKMDLHDNLQQSMLGAKLKLQRIISQLAQDKNPTLEDLEIVLSNLDLSFYQLRNLLDENPDQKLFTRGFTQTLCDMVDNYRKFTNIETILENEWTDEPVLSQSLELIPVVSEVLTNIARHAFAKNIHIRLWQEEDVRKISLADDGIGFSASKVVHKNGLNNIEHRVHKIGILDIQSHPGEGTQFTIILN